ncbi:MAG: photosystem stability/assembly factor-like protein [Panacagrimonas sp.]|jgi:photosystem II stability/assembly factor-like uncharacterized protein|nr:photosystem stability/assembly factor-like protein [Panacagrimonas sp.]
MRSLLSVVTASIVLSVGVMSEAMAGKEIITTLISGIPHSAFFGIDLENGEGVAVGAGGAISESKDGGKTWKAVAESPTTMALLSVAKRGAHSIAVGQSGAVAIVQDGKWQTVDSGSKARLLSVDVNSSGLAIVGGQFGTVLKSTDGGKTWAPSAPDWSLLALEEHFGTGEPTIYAANVTEAGQITITGEFGVMMRSDDGGATWRVVRAIDPKAPTLHAMHLVEAGKGNSYAVGQSGALLISADGGETWTQCDVATKLNFLGVTASATGQVVVTGMRVMYRSENNGMSWVAVDEGDTITDWYQAVRTDEASGRILAVGHSGKIIQIGS